MNKLYGIALAVILALVFLLPASIVVANEPALVLQTERITIRLAQKPCSEPTVLARIKPEARHEFQTARILWQGKWLNACWTILPAGPGVLIVDETGDNGILPLSAFKPEETV